MTPSVSWKNACFQRAAAGGQLGDRGLREQLRPWPTTMSASAVYAISLIRVAGDQHRPALGGELLQQVADPADTFGVEAVDRLVKQQDPRVAEQGGGDAQPLGHAERELPGAAVRGLLDAGNGEHLLDPL